MPSPASSPRRWPRSSTAGCTPANTVGRAGRSSSGCWSRSSSGARPTPSRGTSRPPTTCSRAGSAEQIDRWLRPALRGEGHDAYAVTEEHAGSDPSGIATTARRRDGGWVIDGEKWFVTSGDIATVYIVVANAEGEGPTLFLVDATLPGISVVDDPPFTHTYPHGHPDDPLRGRRGARRGRDRRGRQRATSSSARGSPRSAWGSRRAASARCGGCSTRRPPGR